jgi:hypothetical protein
VAKLRHPRWCDQTKCSANQAWNPEGAHFSGPLEVSSDDGSAASITISLWQPNPDVFVFLEFGDIDSCRGGHELTPRQAAELVSALKTLLALPSSCQALGGPQNSTGHGRDSLE